MAESGTSPLNTKKLCDFCAIPHDPLGVVQPGPLFKKSSNDRDINGLFCDCYEAKKVMEMLIFKH